MNKHTEYYQYLASRSRIGHLYRKYWLYPRLCSRLRGLTLDIGCGIGDMLDFKPDTIGTDINEHNIRHCIERGLNAKVMALNVLPFANGEFDSVLLDNVIEHISDPIPLLNEVGRVLKNHGVVLVGVPGIRGWKCDPDHKIEYNENRLIERMQLAGFIHVESFFTPLWRSEWLSRNIRQYCIYGLFVPTKSFGTPR